MQFDHFDVSELSALAKLDVEASRLDLALEKLKVANKREDRVPELDILLARIYAQLHLFDKAIAHFKKYLEFHPDAVLERFQLGMVYFDKTDFATAMNLWDGILSQYPTHPPALYYRANAKINIGALDDARRDLAVLLKSAPADNLYFGRAKKLLDEIESTDNKRQRTEATEKNIIGQVDNVYKGDF